MTPMTAGADVIVLATVLVNVLATVLLNALVNALVNVLVTVLVNSPDPCRDARTAPGGSWRC